MTKTTKTSKPARSTVKTVATLAELALWCGVSSKTAQTWRKAHDFPVESNGQYSPVRVAEWRLIRQIESGSPTDAELSGPASPMLEKMREERWLMLRMERQEREGKLLNRDDVHQFMLTNAHILRAWGDRMQRAFGHEGETLHRQCLEDMESKTSRMFGPDCQGLDEDRQSE